MNSLKKDIEDGLALLPVTMRSAAAKVLLYTTSRQENPKRLPQQVGGPAVGDYQFEKGGGVKGVLTHKAVRSYAESCCADRSVPATQDAVYQAIKTDPVLAAALARLLYYTDPKTLPFVGKEDDAWALYLRTWRPGAYARQPEELRAKWKNNYADAMAAYGF